MAVKIPAIPEIEDAAELISLVASSTKFKERMTSLFETYDQIKKGLELYRQYQDIDASMGLAQQLVTEAKLVKAQADKDSSAAKAEAEAHDTEIAAKRKAYGQWQNGMKLNQEARDKALDDREAALVKREAAVAEASLTAKFMQDEASKLLKVNDELKRDLEAKLGKLRQITAE